MRGLRGHVVEHAALLIDELLKAPAQTVALFGDAVALAAEPGHVAFEARAELLFALVERAFFNGEIGGLLLVTLAIDLQLRRRVVALLDHGLELARKDRALRLVRFPGFVELGRERLLVHDEPVALRGDGGEFFVRLDGGHGHLLGERGAFAFGSVELAREVGSSLLGARELRARLIALRRDRSDLLFHALVERREVFRLLRGERRERLFLLGRKRRNLVVHRGDERGFLRGERRDHGVLFRRQRMQHALVLSGHRLDRFLVLRDERRRGLFVPLRGGAGVGEILLELLNLRVQARDLRVGFLHARIERGLRGGERIAFAGQLGEGFLVLHPRRAELRGQRVLRGVQRAMLLIERGVSLAVLFLRAFEVLRQRRELFLKLISLGRQARDSTFELASRLRRFLALRAAIRFRDLQLAPHGVEILCQICALRLQFVALLCDRGERLPGFRFRSRDFLFGRLDLGRRFLELLLDRNELAGDPVALGSQIRGGAAVLLARVFKIRCERPDFALQIVALFRRVCETLLDFGLRRARLLEPVLVIGPNPRELFPVRGAFLRRFFALLDYMREAFLMLLPRAFQVLAGIREQCVDSLAVAHRGVERALELGSRRVRFARGALMLGQRLAELLGERFGLARERIALDAKLVERANLVVEPGLQRRGFLGGAGVGNDALVLGLHVGQLGGEILRMRHCFGALAVDPLDFRAGARGPTVGAQAGALQIGREPRDFSLLRAGLFLRLAGRGRFLLQLLDLRGEAFALAGELRVELFLFRRHAVAFLENRLDAPAVALDVRFELGDRARFPLRALRGRRFTLRGLRFSRGGQLRTALMEFGFQRVMRSLEQFSLPSRFGERAVQLGFALGGGRLRLLHELRRSACVAGEPLARFFQLAGEFFP